MEPHFPQWLADRIEVLGFSQRILADHLGVSRSVVSRWLRSHARPSATNCARLAQVLSTPVQEVLVAAGYPSSPSDDPDLLPDERLLLTSYRRLPRGYQQLLQGIVRDLEHLVSSGGIR